MKQLSISFAVAAMVFLLGSYLFEAGPFQKGFTVYPPLSALGDTDWDAPIRKARIRLISVSALSLGIGIITYVLLSRTKITGK